MPTFFLIANIWYFWTSNLRCKTLINTATRRSLIGSHYIDCTEKKRVRQLHRLRRVTMVTTITSAWVAHALFFWTTFRTTSMGGLQKFRIVFHAAVVQVWTMDAIRVTQDDDCRNEKCKKAKDSQGDEENVAWIYFAFNAETSSNAKTSFGWFWCFCNHFELYFFLQTFEHWQEMLRECDAFFV